MLKAGDRVKFLNAVGGGRITGFVSPRVANVEDDQGFEVPFLISELVLDERFDTISEPRSVSGLKKSDPATARKEERKPKKESLPLFASSAGKPASDHPAFYLAFVPEVPTLPLSGEIRAWLVNDSGYHILYNLSLFRDGKYFAEKAGKLAPYSRIPLKGFGLQDFSDFPGFGFQILPYEQNSSVLLPSLVKTLKINPVKFYKETSYTGNAYFEKRAMLFEIREKDLSGELEKLRDHDFSAPKVTGENGDAGSSPVVKKKIVSGIREVDLHIQELVDSFSGLSSKEILDIQMERFTGAMEEAIRDGTRRIVFIHGVGQGTLKNELRKELGTKYKKYDVQDASFREYGYGATMVILRKG